MGGEQSHQRGAASQEGEAGRWGTLWASLFRMWVIWYLVIHILEPLDKNSGQLTILTQHLLLRQLGPALTQGLKGVKGKALILLQWLALVLLWMGSFTTCFSSSLLHLCVRVHEGLGHHRHRLPSLLAEESKTSQGSNKGVGQNLAWPEKCRDYTGKSGGWEISTNNYFPLDRT